MLSETNQPLPLTEEEIKTNQAIVEKVLDEVFNSPIKEGETLRDILTDFYNHTFEAERPMGETIKTFVSYRLVSHH